MQGRHHRLVSRAERAPGSRCSTNGSTRIRERTRRVCGREPGREGGAVRRQPDRARQQRPAAARRRGLRAAPGAADHHEPASAARDRRGGAQLRRPRVPRRDQRAACAQGGGAGRRRHHRGLRRRGRPRGHGQSLCARARNPPVLRRHAGARRRHVERRGRACGAGDRRGHGLHRHAVPGDDRGQRPARVQADARRLDFRRRRVHLALHRREGQLPEAQRGGGWDSIRTTCPKRTSRR